MRAVIPLLISLLLFGCSQQPGVMEADHIKSEKQLRSLFNNASTLRAELVKSKEACQEVIAKSGVKVKEADDMLAKLDTLLGYKPKPDVPAVVPIPVVPVTPVAPVIPSPAPQPAPGPTPVPVPPPSPTPAGPVDGRFGVENGVWKIVQAVESPDRQAEADALAAVFTSVAKDVRDGKLDASLSGPQWYRISLALTAGNKPVIAKHPAAWEGPATMLGKKIGLFYKEGKLQSNEDWADLLDAIAVGLRFRYK